MAGGVGALTVSLGLDAADYVQGLNKADQLAKNASNNITNNFTTAARGASIAFTALATAGAAAFAAINTQANNIANLQDIAEKIGDTASAVSSLQLAADLSETSLDTVAAASIKLTASLSKVTDETKGAGAAITALGLDFQGFKDLSPVEQIDAVSKALAGFEDGAQKTAVAVALFGKSGAEIIPFLNDLADEGQKQIRLTDEQIAQADEYVKAQARIKSQLDITTQSLASDAIPAMTKFIDITGRIVKGLSESEAASTILKVSLAAVGSVFETLATGGALVNYVFTALGTSIGFIAAASTAIATGDFKSLPVMFDALRDDARKARKELEDFLEAVEGGGKADVNPKIKAVADPKPVLDFVAAQAKAKKEVIETNDRAKELADTYADLFKKTESLFNADKTQIQLLQEEVDKFSQIDGAVRQYLNTRLELANALENEKADMLAFNVGLENEAESFNLATEAAEAYNQTLSTSYTDTFTKLQDENQTLTASLIRNDKDRAKKQLEIENQRRIDAIYSLNLEQEARDDLLQQEQTNAELRIKILENTKDGFEELKNSIEGFSRDSAQSIVDFAFGAETSLKGAVDGMLKQLARLAIQKSITDPLFNSFSDSMNSGGFGSIFGSFFSGMGFASGGNPPVGKASLVGERGAELFVPKTAGTIIPNNKLGSGQTNNISITINSDGSRGQQGNPNETARQIESAVTAILIKQKRQAGILS